MSPEVQRFNMCPTIKDAESLITAYNQRYNTQFRLHEKYDLFPESKDDYGFRNPWPCYDKAGVYLILSSDEEIIYVGQSRSMGSRFYRYFKDKEGSCVIMDNWTKKPRYIIAIPSEEGAAYERLSLEEYLIERLAPSDNTLGK